MCFRWVMIAARKPARYFVRLTNAKNGFPQDGVHPCHKAADSTLSVQASQMVRYKGCYSNKSWEMRKKGRY
jgi:hypothetical protein